MWRTAPLSAPSGEADGLGGGGWGGATGTAEVDDARGSAAYLAATCAIDTSITSPPPRRSGLSHRSRRLQSAQRVGNRVAAEHRSLRTGTDQPTRHRGVVAERRTVRLATITPDAQPNSSGPAGYVVGAQLAAPQRRGPGALDDDVGGG